MAVGKTQLDLFDYDGFVSKFKAAKTTDDCYTPEAVYAIVRDWACSRFGIEPEACVRPFWPDSDFTRFDYPEGCVVLDNPPFSIITEVCRWYLDEGIDFFLFCPKLTALSNTVCMRTDHVFVNENITYENGAEVPTAFITNLGDKVVETACDLERSLREHNRAERRAKARDLPVYRYPDHVLTAAMCARFAKYGVEFSVARDECCAVKELDSMRARGKAIFGGGLLLTHKAAAEKAAAEKAAAEKAAAEKAAAHVWQLSEREVKTIELMERRRPE